MPTNTTSILQPVDQGVILTFKSYIFCKAIGVIVISLLDLGKVNQKPLRKDLPFKMSFRTLVICGQNININRSLEEVDSNSHKGL